MAMDCDKLTSSTMNDKSINKVENTTARLTLVSTSMLGLFFVGRAVVSADLQWGLLAMIAFTVAFSVLTVNISRCPSSTPLRIPLSHVALFAGSLALGPHASLTGAFGGMALLIFSPPQRRSLLDILYIIFKPAAVCALASAAFTASGGETFQPHSVNSTIPVLLAGLIYVAGHALSTAGLGVSRSESIATLRPASVAVKWSICLFCGYSVAVLYAAAPPYIMIAPVAAGVLAMAAVKLPQVTEEVAEEPVEQVAGDIPEQEEPVQRVAAPSVFVDELTGLASHRYLMMFLDREISRSLRADSPLAVAAFDVDGFTKLHDADTTLVELGRRLKAGLRDYDLIARHSSGRLVVVLPDTPAQSAVEVCKRLHTAACSLTVNDRPISVSVGIATVPDNGTTSDDLINASHYAINRGRFSGKGGVHVCERLDKAS